MNNFKLYAQTRFKLKVSTSSCFTALKKGEATPSRVTVLLLFFKECKRLWTQTAIVTEMYGEPRGLHKWFAVWKRRSIMITEWMFKQELASILDLSESTVHRVLTGDLKLRNVCSVWIPQSLTEINKKREVCIVTFGCFHSEQEIYLYPLCLRKKLWTVSGSLT